MRWAGLVLAAGAGLRFRAAPGPAEAEAPAGGPPGGPPAPAEEAESKGPPAVPEEEAELKEKRLADPKAVWRRYLGGTPPPELTGDSAVRAAMSEAAAPEDEAADEDEAAPTTTPAPAAPLPAMEPTLAPWRFRNYVPVPTEQEAEVLRFGPTPVPERKTGIDNSCVWQPGQYRCGCKDMLKGCNEASSVCEIKLQSEEMEAPEALKRHFKAVFDAPLLNTLQQPTARMDESEHGVLGFPVPNYPWPKDDFAARLAAQQAAFRPPQPAEFGHPLFADNAVPKFGAPSSECTAEEFLAIETCFTYFFGCFKNLKDLDKWRNHVDSVTRQELRYG